MALGLAATAAIFKVVRGAGLEPAQYCYRQDLNQKFQNALPLISPMESRKIDSIYRRFPNSVKIVIRLGARFG